MKKNLLTTVLFFTLLFSAGLMWSQVVGSNCQNPMIMDLPIVDYADNTEIYGNDYTSAMLNPVSSYLNGNDFVVQFTLESQSYLTGSVAGSWTGLFIVDTEPNLDDPVSTFARATGSAGNSFSNEILDAGTYYAIVSTWPAPQFTDFTLNLSAVPLPEDPELHAMPNMGVFGDVAMGSYSDSITFTLSNMGPGFVDFAPEDVSITGLDSDQFILTNIEEPVSLGTLESVDISVVMAPTVMGIIEADVEIDWGLGILTIPLTGNSLDATITAPHFENFDDVTAPALPLGWSAIVEHTATSAYVATNTFLNPYSPPNHARLYYSSADENAELILITPPVNNISENRIRFMTRVNSVFGDIPHLQVGTITDPQDPETFNMLTAVTYEHANYFEVIVNFEEYVGDDEYIAFRFGLPSNTFRSLLIDDFYYEPIPADAILAVTPEEIDFGLNHIYTQSPFVNVTFTNVGVGEIILTADDFEITGADSGEFIMAEIDEDIIVTPNEPQTLGIAFSPVTVGEKEAVLEITWEGETYTVDLSGEAYDATVYPPHLEDFTTTPFPPTGWERFSGILDEDTEMTPVTSTWLHHQFGNTGGVNNSAYINIYGTRNHWLVSPVVDLGDEPYLVEFDIALTPWTGVGDDINYLGPDDYVAFVISTDGGNTWSNANVLVDWEAEAGISNTGEHIVVDVSEYSGMVRFGIYAERPTGWQPDLRFYFTNFEVSEYTEQPLASFFEDFNSAETPDLPAGWQSIVEDPQTTRYIRTWAAGSGANEAISPPNQVQIACGDNQNVDLLLISPLTTNFDTNTLSFWANISIGSRSGDILVGTITDPEDAETFESATTVHIGTDSVYEQYTVEFDDITENTYIAFKFEADMAFTVFLMDNIAWEEETVAPTPAPENLTASVIDEAVLLEWDAPEVRTLLGYNVYRDDVQINTTVVEETHYTDSSIMMGELYSYYVTAVYEHGESDPSNTVDIFVSDGSYILVGDDTTTANTLPFNFFWRNSLSQTIYMAEEMNHTPGVITGIDYFNSFTSDLYDMPVKIWMANTSETELLDGWYNYDDFTLVFDGEVDFPTGENTISIPLQVPFIYTGDNLVIMANRVMDTTWHSSSDHFYYTATLDYPNRSRNVQSDSIEYDPAEYPVGGTLTNRVPNTGFHMAVAEDTFVQIGDGETSANTLPLNFWFRSSLTQTLYMEEEFGGTFGIISDIEYYNNFSSNLVDMPVLLFMGTTTQQDLNDDSGGWISAEDLTLVYDGTLNFPSGENTINIPLQVPFEYTGDNLVIMAHRPMDTTWHSSLDHFYYTETPEYPQRSRNVQSDSAEYDPYDPPAFLGILTNRVPNTGFYFSTDTEILFPPTGLAAVAGNGQVHLSWNAPNISRTEEISRAGLRVNVTENNRDMRTLQGYNIYRDDEIINTELVLDTEYTDTDVVNDVTYSYYVTAVYEAGESSSSNTVSVMPFFPYPTELSAVIVDGTVELSWLPAETLRNVSRSNPTMRAAVSANRNSRTLLGYNLYRNDILINAEVIEETEYVDTDVEYLVPYTYYVTAVYDDGESVPSNSVNVSLLPEGSVQIGAGEEVNAPTGAAPVNIYFRSLRGQMVYTVDEINAAGFTGPGELAAMGFYIESAPIHPLPDFIIRMKHTTAVDASEHDDGPFDYVYSNASYMPVEGDWDILVLDTPFEWNGVDNILVDTAFAQVPSWNSSGQQRVFDSPNGFRFVRSDGADQSYMPTTQMAQYKPQVQMIFGDSEPQLLPPTNLAAVYSDGAIHLSWEEPGTVRGVSSDENMTRNTQTNSRSTAVSRQERAEFSSSMVVNTITNREVLRYNVYRDGVQVNDEIVEEPYYIDDADLVDGVEYSYYVTAVYEDGESDPSNVVELFFGLHPSNIAVTVSSHTVMWEDEFIVYISVSEILESWNISSYGFELYYDEDMLDFVGIPMVEFASTLSATGGMPVYNDIGGHITFGWAHYLPIDTEGDDLLVLKFEALNPGMTEIDLGEFIFNTYDITNIVPGAIDIMEFMIGDVNRDGEVTPMDASIVLQYYVEMDPIPEIDPIPWTDLSIMLADVDLNGAVQPMDASYILQYYVGIIDALPVLPGRNTQDSIASVDVIYENGLLNFYSEKQIFGLGVDVPSDYITYLGQPVINGTSWMTAQNIDDSIYRLALARAEVTSRDNLLLSIPVLAQDIDQIELILEVNNQEAERISVQTLNTEIQVPELVTALRGNYPNPFNPDTNIAFTLADAGKVTIEVYNILGQKVITLVNEEMEPGNHKVIWNGQDERGKEVGSGIFFYRMSTGKYSSTGKMIMLK